MRHHWFFDFDGTLCDTEADIKAAYRGALADLSLDASRFDELYSTGPTLASVLALMYPESAGDPAFYARFMEAFKRHYDMGGFPSTRPYPGVEEWLRGLKSAGAVLYIATNKRMAPLKALVARCGWEGMFAGMFAPDAAPGGPRTKKDNIAAAMAAHRISPDDGVMVGDTRGDVEAGRAAGLYTIGCTWGYGTREELQGADEIYDAGRFQK